MSDYWKKRMDELEKETKKSPSQSYWDRKMQELENEQKKKKTTVLLKDEDEDDIAPIKSTKSERKNEIFGLDFFQKGAFEDGYQVGDVTKSILGTAGDIGLNAVKGVWNIGEGIGDLASYGVAAVADKLGEDAFARGVREKAKESLFDNATKSAQDFLNKYSVLGETSDAILQGVGQVAGIYATGGLGSAAGLGSTGVSALTFGTMFLSGTGSGMGEAYQMGANDLQALKIGLNSGAADAVSELIFAGLGKEINALGFSKGLSSADNILAKLAGSKIKNQVAKNVVEFGIKSGAEGLEEVIAGIAQAYGKYDTLLKDQGMTFGDVLKDENLLEQFVVGSFTSGLAQSSGLNIANQTGTDFITGLNQDEQAVVDKEVKNRIAEAEKDGTKLTAKQKANIQSEVEKDLEKGYISTDTIEETLASDLFEKYKRDSEWETSIQNEYDELYSMKNADKSNKQIDREAELKKHLESIKGKDSKALRSQITAKVSERVKGSRLAESYNEKARAFEGYVADYTKYTGAKHPKSVRETVESAIKAGVSNTNRVHDFVDMVAKTSADTGLSFSFQSNKQVKAEFIERTQKRIDALKAIEQPTAEEASQLTKLTELLEKVESGKITVNGSNSNGSIVLNLDSPKVLNRTVGHELTHSLEKVKSYDALKESLFAYAKTKGIDIDSEINTRKLMYDGVAKADPEAELVSDLVGDFLFNDIEYVNHLSVENRNVFQRIFDEIKHLLKLATAGSKEARQLEQVKRNMEKAYLEAENGRQSKEISDSDTKYSIRKEAPPKNTGVAYKVFYVKDGKLYPPMVANPGGADTPMGVWLNADTGTAAPPSKTGRAQVKAGGKGTQGGSGSLAFRPGWHLGDLPRASQFDRVNPETGNKELFPENFVWAEVEYAKDVDYQEEAMSYGYTENGKFRHAYAGLPRLPENGYYRYRTNPKPDTVPWVITGAMKVNRLLSDAEVNAILEKNGVAPVHRQGGDVGLDKFGFNDDGTVKYSLSPEQQEFFKDSVVRDENGNLKVMYHGTPNGDFTVFKDGTYFTESKDYADRYQNPGASSISTGKVASNPKTFEVYLNIKKPFDIADADAREIYINEYIKGGNAMGINPYLSDAEYAKIESIDWTEGEDLRDFLIENEYDYDGLVLDEGGTGGYGDEVQSRGKSYVVFSPEQVKNVDNQNPTDNPDIHKSLSGGGAGFTPVGRNEVYGRDLLQQIAPIQEEVAPVAENATSEVSNASPEVNNASPNATVAENATVSEEENVAPVAISETETTTEVPVAPANEDSSVAEMFPDDLAPVQQEFEALLTEQDEIRQALETAVSMGDYNQVSSLAADYESVTARIREIQAQEDERFETLSDEDMPPEMDAPYPGEPNEVADPFADRDIYDVSSRSVKAYQYENPEVKPFFTEAALGMLGDLHNGTKGERIFNDDVYYQSGGEKGWMGTKRTTTDDIAELLDTWHYTYDQIEKGLNAIIEDDGKENNAVSKRIEFMLNDRLLNGYTGVWGEPIPANQDYINLINEKQITEYSREAFDNLFANADDFAPTMEESYAPILNSDPRKGKNVPTYANASGQQTYIPNGATYDAIPSDDADIAPMYDATAKKGVPEGQQAFMPDAGVPKTVTRKELHASIMDNIKSRFAARGFDFDNVLKKAKNLSTFATVDNTPQRVMEKALGYKEGGILSDITVNKVAQNETDGIKWLNSFTDRKNGLLAQISKQYGIKPRSKESAAAQMYAEGFYVGENNEIISYGDRELAMDFPDPVKQAQIKGLARDKRIRQIYDETLKAINESRTRNAYPEIPRLDNYFLHFRAMNDTFSKLGLPFNPNDIRAKDLPTDLNGVTADLKPGQPYFASAQHRTGKRTSFDLLGGLEQYLTSAKNQIYHIDDIQTLRALRNYIADTYGQATLEGLDALSEEEQQDRIEQVYGAHLSTFAKFLNEEANVLAGKTALIDRGLEGIIGRRGMTFLDSVNRQVGSNMVGYNVSSSLTNFLAPVQAFAKTNKASFIKGMAQFVSNKVKSINGNGDGFAEQSPVMIRRKGAERFDRTFWQKMSDPGYVLMSAVDNVSTELIARAKYNEFVGKGMSSQQAHIEADKWTSRLMGDRSLGQQPQLYNSKMLGIVTKFQLEVRNQLDSQFYDTIQETKASNEDIENGLMRNAKTAAKVGSTFFQLAVAQHLFGKAFESVAGYNPAFDIISAIIKTFGWDDDDESEDTVLDNIEQGFFELLEDMPYASTFTGGRIPISSALPVAQFIKGKDQYGNEKSRWETLGEAVPYYIMPGGYGQVKKTAAGMKMFSDDHPIAGSYTDSGSLRFPVDDTLVNRAQAAVFGQYASSNARDYFDNDLAPLKENQIQEFVDVGISIQDYRKYREGLKGKDTLGEKVAYINSLDLPIATKNLLVNNISDRKEAIDLSDFGEYDDWGEFEYAHKYPDKYAFLQDNNISVDQYENFDDDTKNAWSWAYQNPGKYAMSRAVTSDIVEYRRYASDLNNIKADKDYSGKTISGSRKEKVLDYINSLDISYGERLILFKNEYNSDDTYNYEIIDYLNSRSDLSFEERIAILRELGFDVTDDGNISWY